MISSLLMVALALWASVRSHEAPTPIPSYAYCSASALSRPFIGPEHVTSVQNYGCEGAWAFLWATIGSGQEAIGVTEVLHFDQADTTWRNASRLKVCKPDVMPTYIPARLFLELNVAWFSWREWKERTRCRYVLLVAGSGLGEFLFEHGFSRERCQQPPHRDR